MKHYPKNYQELFLPDSRLVKLEDMETVSGEQPRDLARKFEAVFREQYANMWDFMIKFVWLEHQVVFRRRRRFRWGKFGHIADSSFSRFIKEVVGIEHRTLTENTSFRALSTYLKELYPDFLNRDPFVDFDYFQFPFDHVTPDFLEYVYQVENRMEILTYAEEQKMTYFYFRNWVNNYVLSYNDDKGTDFYTIGTAQFRSYIKHRDWSEVNRLKHIFTEEDNGKTQTNSNNQQPV